MTPDVTFTATTLFQMALVAVVVSIGAAVVRLHREDRWLDDVRRRENARRTLRRIHKKHSGQSPDGG